MRIKVFFFIINTSFRETFVEFFRISFNQNNFIHINLTIIRELFKQI